MTPAMSVSSANRCPSEQLRQSAIHRAGTYSLLRVRLHLTFPPERCPRHGGALFQRRRLSLGGAFLLRYPRAMLIDIRSRLGAPRVSALVPSPSGNVAGTRQTLRTMRAIVSDYRSRVELIDLATSILLGVPEGNEVREIDAIYQYVRRAIRYVKDVLDVETLATPTETLMRGAGDCDDFVILIASLLESVGVPTRFVVAGYESNEFEHVYLQAWASDVGAWLDMDAVARTPLGVQPPGARVIYVERV